MAVYQYTKHEIMKIVGSVITATNEYINKLAKAPNTEMLQDYYTGIKDGTKLVANNLSKMFDDIEQAKDQVQKEGKEGKEDKTNESIYFKHK